MKLRQNRLILLLVSLLLTGCNSPKPSEDDIPSDSEQISETTSEVPSEGSEDVDNPVVNTFNDFTYPEDAHIPASEEYLKFWHPKTKINVNIKASNEIIKLIDECGDKGGTREDLYFPVNVTFNVDGKEYFYEEVGMRQKGIHLARISQMTEIFMVPFTLNYRLLKSGQKMSMPLTAFKRLDKR